MFCRSVIALLIVLSVGALATHNLNYPGIWWDETAQFWISQGLSNYAEPYASPRGLYEVGGMNLRENLDPGGFSLLLHVWTKVSKSLEWMRMLPLIFLLLAQGGLGWLAWRLSRSPTFALIAASTPLTYPAILYFGFEIRAYSMEMAGIVCGTLALLFMLEEPSWIRMGLLGIVSATFMTSRYSFIFFIVAVTGTLGYTLCQAKAHSRITWLVLSTGFFIPVAISGLLILTFMLLPQRWKEMINTTLGVMSPMYTQSSVLLSNENWIELVTHNVLSPAALPITVAMAFFLFGRQPLYRALEGQPFKPARKEFHSNLQSLYLLILFLQVISILASLFGLYPWDITARWSAYLLMVSAMALTLLGADAIVLFKIWSKGKEFTTSWRIGFSVGCRWLGVLLMIGITVHSFQYQRRVVSRSANLAPQLERIHTLAPPDGTVFVTWREVPAVRYLHEYGPFRNHSRYPEMFRFEKTSEWRDKRPINAQREGLQFIVTALPIQDAQARFPDHSLQKVGPPESRLLEIKTETSVNRRAGTYKRAS